MSRDKEKHSLSPKGKIIAIVVAVILGIFIITLGTYSIVTEQSPISAVKSVLTANDKELCAKWQSQDKPELNAYVFYDDGTYDSYLSNFNFDGVYTVDSNQITLKNPETKKELVYKFTIHGDVLTLTLVKEDGSEPAEKTVTKYDKVDELNMKSLTDIISELTTAKSE